MGHRLPLRFSEAVIDLGRVPCIIEAKEAIKKCNRCRWIRFRQKWQKKLGNSLQEAPSTQPWGLRCRDCYAACEQPESSTSSYILGTKGAKRSVVSGIEWSASVVCFRTASAQVPASRFADVLQLEDLRRHQQSTMHIQALEKLNGRGVAVEAVDAVTVSTVPTAAQVRLAVEVLQQPQAGQGASYASRCELGRRGDPSNFPWARSQATDHADIICHIATCLRDQAWPLSC